MWKVRERTGEAFFLFLLTEQIWQEPSSFVYDENLSIDFVQPQFVQPKLDKEIITVFEGFSLQQKETSSNFTIKSGISSKLLIYNEKTTIVTYLSNNNDSLQTTKIILNKLSKKRLAKTINDFSIKIRSSSNSNETKYKKMKSKSINSFFKENNQGSSIYDESFLIDFYKDTQSSDKSLQESIQNKTENKIESSRTELETDKVNEIEKQMSQIHSKREGIYISSIDSIAIENLFNNINNVPNSEANITNISNQNNCLDVNPLERKDIHTEKNLIFATTIYRL